MKCADNSGLNRSKGQAPSPTTLERSGFLRPVADARTEVPAHEHALTEAKGGYTRKLPLRQGDIGPTLFDCLAPIDLPTYIYNQASPEPGSATFLWMVTHMLGLASALQHVHTVRTDRQWRRYIDLPSYGPYFDYIELDPETILMLSEATSEEREIFKIRSHNLVYIKGLRKQRNATNPLPELRKPANIPPSTDVLLLGRVFLEVLHWLLGQYDREQAYVRGLISHRMAESWNPDPF